MEIERDALNQVTGGMGAKHLVERWRGLSPAWRRGIVIAGAAKVAESALLGGGIYCYHRYFRRT